MTIRAKVQKIHHLHHQMEGRKTIKIILILGFSMLIIGMWKPLGFLPIPDYLDWFPLGPKEFKPYHTGNYFFFLSLYLNIWIFSYIIYELSKTYNRDLKPFSLIIFLFCTLRVVIFIVYSYAELNVKWIAIAVFIFSLTYSLFIKRKWRKF